MSERFEQETLRCPKCHQVIPNNEQSKEHKNLLICLSCAGIASNGIFPTPAAKPKKLKPGEKIEGQAEIDVPGQYIT